MRRIGNRPRLPDSTARRLRAECAAIDAAAAPIEEAKARYAAARRAVWFRPVITSLGRMSGLGQRCMYCSGSESAQVEHYRPKTTHPAIALEWANLLWSCGVCNQAKGNRFDASVAPINPIDDDVWSHFFIDEFGNLSPRWSIAENSLDQRAMATIALHALDRQALQECRQERLIDLRARVNDTMLLLAAGELTRDELELRALTWFEQPFQPDIADYFLAGPGALDSAEPFRRFLEMINAP